MSEKTQPVLGMILKGYPRISETFISNEILLLEKLGFRIHIISMRQPRENFSHESVKQIKAKVDYLPETILLPLPRFLYHNFLLACRQPRRYGEALQIMWRRFRRTRKKATIKHLLQAGYLVHRFLPGSGITHLHAHFAHSPTSVAMFASYLSGLPFSFTAHAKDIYTSDPAQLAEKIGLARFVVTCTEYNRRHLASLANGHKTPLHRLYHGIDLNLFAAPDEMNVSPNPPYKILTVARLTEKKGLPTVYKALRLMRDRGLDFRHTLIGDGDDREKLEALIRELGLSDVTSLIGTRPHHEVLAQFRQSDLFVLGCQLTGSGDRDGIPNVFVESMAVGVPVVGTRVSAIPELIEHGETGLLVEPNRPDLLAEAMTSLLTDRKLRAQFIPEARAKVLRDFDNKALIQLLAEIYRREGIGETEQPDQTWQS